MPEVIVYSFGYLHGDPPPADVTIDVRKALLDPHIDADLRQLDGFNRRVRQRVMETPGAKELVVAVELVARAMALGSSQVTIAFGCAGGRHRSVVLAKEVAIRLGTAGPEGYRLDAKDRHLHVSCEVVTSPRSEQEGL